jgi:hypothetical protein
LTVKTPADPEQDKVDVWDAPRTMAVGLIEQVKPGGETSALRLIVPVKPFRGATVMVDCAPPLALTDVGLAERLKSGGEIVTV